MSNSWTSAVFSVDSQTQTTLSNPSYSPMSQDCLSILILPHTLSVSNATPLSPLTNLCCISPIAQSPQIPASASHWYSCSSHRSSNSLKNHLLFLSRLLEFFDSSHSSGWNHPFSCSSLLASLSSAQVLQFFSVKSTTETLFAEPQHQNLFEYFSFKKWT